ncbi:hypothetical protein [Acidithiobacillus ferrooxidans]|uniref:hypothetical protein n=1 Tax=Acidithiobacillus ferrooxidans TaxID=920 RepID=UPI000B2C47C0|nr:hypothetical protein [Acidithiobacillus ferrooxidans]
MLPERFQDHGLFQECWMRLNREGRAQDVQSVRDTGSAYVSLFAEKHIGSPFVQKDLMSAARMVDAMASIALYAWRTKRKDVGSEEIYQHFLEVPFSQWIERGVALYRQVIGDPSETDWTTENVAVGAFLRDYPVFLRVCADVKTLEHVASALGFGNDGAFHAARDALMDLREDVDILGQVLRSVMAGVAMGLEKPWLALYPDGMLEILRTLYLDRADGLVPPWTRTPLPEVALERCLSDPSSAILTAQDRERLAACLQSAVTELQRLWDKPEYLSEMLACPGLEEKTRFDHERRRFRAAFFDTSQQMFDSDHCVGTREWDLAAFSLPLWVVFLEKASGLSFDGDGDDEMDLLDYLCNQCMRATEHPLHWERALSFLLTESPWVPHLRAHFTLILDTLKRAMTMLLDHGCANDRLRATMAILYRLEYEPQAAD